MGTRLNLLSDSNQTPHNEGWQNRGNQISSDEIINKIKNPNADQATHILTAVPSPLARYHIFDIAFQYLSEAIRSNKGIPKSNAFFKLVSGILDAFEIVFYFNALQKAYPELQITAFSVESIISELKASQTQEHHEFASVLDKYYSSAPFKNIRKQSFIIKHGTDIVAITSPLTFLAIPEDTACKINAVFGRERSFFDLNDPVHLRDRPEEFIFYLYAIKYQFQQNYHTIDSFDNFFNYLHEEKSKLKDATLIRRIDAIDNSTLSKYSTLKTAQVTDVHILGKNFLCLADIDTSYALEIKSTISKNYNTDPKFPAAPVILKDGLDPITGKSNNRVYDIKDQRPFDQRTIPFRGLKYPTLCLGDFFTENLVIVDYKIGEHFRLPSGFTRANDFSFLLPIKPVYFEFFTIDDLINNLRFSGDKTNCLFELDIPVANKTTVTLQRRYSVSGNGNTNSGKIQKLSFGMAFFPLLKSANDRFNDYYSAMLIDGEYQDFAAKSSDVKAEFFTYSTNNSSVEQLPTQESIRVKKDRERGVIFYELNKCYDFIRISFDGFGIEMAGLIIPEWPVAPQSRNVINVAVDFGTTNTTVALKIGTARPETLEYEVTDRMLVTLNDLDPATIQQTKVGDLVYPRFTLREINFFETLYTYYLPIKMSSDHFISFPIRSAVREKVSGNAAQGLFRVRNIAFSHNKSIANCVYPEKVFTDLKWGRADNLENNTRIKDFFRSVLILARTMVIANGGDPSSSELVTFYPSSLSANMKRETANAWVNAYSGIFHSNRAIKQLTESQAPADYMLNNFNNQIKNGRMFGEHVTLIIDIGGGSTDVAVFESKDLKLQTSLKFAGNDIWSTNIARQYLDIFQSYYPTLKINQLEGGESLSQVISEFLAEYDKDVLYETQPFELFNFIFTVDNELEKNNHEKYFQIKLKADDTLKFVVIYHFLSIIYHMCELLRFYELPLEKIRFINLTGQGSNSLRIIESVTGAKPQATEKMVRIFIEQMGGKVNGDLEVSLIENSKEITAWGGLEALGNRNAAQINNDDINPVYYLGTGNKTDVFDFSQSIETETFVNYKDAILGNLHQFHSILLKTFDQNIGNFSLRNELGIDNDRDMINWLNSVANDNTLSDVFDILVSRLPYQYAAEVNHGIFFEQIRILIDRLYTANQGK